MDIVFPPQNTRPRLQLVEKPAISGSVSPNNAPRNRNTTPNSLAIEYKTNNGFSPAPAVNRHAFPLAISYPGFYDPKPTGNPTPPHYLNMGSSLPMNYNTPSLAHLHQYLVAAHLQSGLANPLRNVPLPVHSSPLYKSTNEDQGDFDRKRKRSDSGIEDKFDSKSGRLDHSKHNHVSVVSCVMFVPLSRLTVNTQSSVLMFLCPPFS